METKGEMMDRYFLEHDKTAGPGAEIGYGLAATVIGTASGMKNNVLNLLPVAEIETLLDSHASTASKWEAVFMGISKVASLAALGAGARQNVARTTPGPSLSAVEVNVAANPRGGMFDRHASAFIKQFSILYERDGGGNTRAYTTRPNRWAGDPREVYPAKGTDIYVTRGEMTKLLDYIERNRWRGGWRRQGAFKSIVFDNCSMEIGRMLRSIGIDTISVSPSLLKFSLEHQNIFTAMKSFLPNLMIERTERKK
jgi:hypothetical protein